MMSQKINYNFNQNPDGSNNKNVKSAFHWIINILRGLNIPFQIAGGLAANIYGANRALEDIDIDIPEEYFPLVKEEIKDFIVYGPAQFKDEIWDLLLMTLNYQGQFIDLSGAYSIKIFNKNTQEWQTCSADFSKSEIHKCFDVDVPVITKNELLFYKKIIARPVDVIDVEQIEKEQHFDANNITIALAHKLIANQFPEYTHLNITDVEKQGHDNRTFRLGENLLIRMPTAESYALKAPNEQSLLPKLAPCFTVSIPSPIKMGEPSKDYPYPFSIYKWLKGKSINLLTLEENCLEQLAYDLAKFLNELENIDNIAGPGPGPGQHNW